jgi:hypothetical protein
MHFAANTNLWRIPWAHLAKQEAKPLQTCAEEAAWVASYARVCSKYVALPAFGEVDDNAPADSLVCDLWIIGTKFGPLF